MGARFSHFATPPTREAHFFHLFNTSPAGSSKITKIVSWIHGLGDSSWKMDKTSGELIGVLLGRIRTEHVFKIDTNSEFPLKSLHISTEISTILIYASTYAMEQMLQISFESLFSLRNFNNSVFRAFWQILHRNKRPQIDMMKPSGCRFIGRVTTAGGWSAMFGRASAEHASRHVFASMLASSDGGSAMHMKCPDVIGREAGSGTTQDWKGPNVFRACPK